MVRVKFTDKKGRSWARKFPTATLADIKRTAKIINPQIQKVEYYRKRTKRR